MRVIVSGSRYWPDPRPICWGLSWLHIQSLIMSEPLTVVHGACQDRRGRLRGADRWADEWAQKVQALGSRWVRVERYPASDFGPWPGCGPIRNRYMAMRGADVLLAFPMGVSRGTRGMIRIAHEHKIHCRIVEGTPELFRQL